MGRHGHAAGGFRLLFVCTGNVCRSPFAEILTRHLLTERAGGAVASRFEVASAGVAAAVGSGLHRYTRRELAPWGLDGPASDLFCAQQLEAGMVAQADLVLCAGTAHRADVVELAPLALALAFSLREFARLANSVDPARLPPDPVERARELVGLARSRRGMLPGSPDDDQIPDPIGRGGAAHRQSARLIRDAVVTIVDIITPPP